MVKQATETLVRLMWAEASASRSAVNDRELLRRFADTGDQRAFAALVQRHAGMVFGVCRRALVIAQDAEDACQATFLVLARKAKGGRWQSSVANWLYATARGVARNARVAAQRRAERERRAAVSEAAQPVDQMTGRELLAALDEELDRLPPRYREPLVLCYLEGLTRDEAAARLGVPVGTVKIQLERGRKRLRDALTVRGCALGAGLLASAATAPVRASAPHLVQAVVAAVAGMPPAAVAALAEKAIRGGLVKQLKVGLVALVAVGTLAFALVRSRSTRKEWSRPNRSPQRKRPRRPSPLPTHSAIRSPRVRSPDSGHCAFGPACGRSSWRVPPTGPNSSPSATT
jgi:RNA polymerase sigma factor (sigma-70 family)